MRLAVLQPPAVVRAAAYQAADAVAQALAKAGAYKVHHMLVSGLGQGRTYGEAVLPRC